MAAASQDSSLSMRVALLTITTTFPKVKQLDTEVLENWMEDNETNLILLDVREIEEYKVSHLPGAIFVKPDEPIDIAMKKINNKLKETESNGHVKIVAYCSLGYRSCSLVQEIYRQLKRLQETGFYLSMEVYNLAGSIFKWANEGRTMVDCKNEQTVYCHPYNIIWGRLLASHLRKHQPPSAQKTKALPS